MSLAKSGLQNFQSEKIKSFGTNILADGKVQFVLPAPAAKSVDLIISDTDQHLPMRRRSPEVFELVSDTISVGTKYQYLIDGKTIVPDPASRYQPEGVHGPSQLVDPLAFKWQNNSWTGKKWSQAVIYELHVGTFTKEGTFKAVIEKLDDLCALGVTALELMPIAEFPGNRNWGYDGVLLFAPTHNYGSPDDLKALVDACHQKGLMIFLDVVYNHFGPEGNYLHSYADYFFTDKYKTPWGKAINFDGINSNLVREFFIDNALYWLSEYRFDGLRLDAVHAINDSSEKHIVTEICETVHSLKENGREIHIILENDSNIASFLKRDSKNQVLCATAQWNDDIHHIMHVICTNEKEGYYSDYALPDNEDASISKLGRALSEGFIYQGEISLVHDGKKRGEPSKQLAATAFISFLQNHDQIGNRAFGERISKIAQDDKLISLTAIFLLSPEIPMLFMGEEWSASSPFYYFCNMGPDLAPLITKGRREEFRQFASFNDPAKLETIPDPSAPETFNSCILNWQERDKADHQDRLEYYTSLLQARKDFIMPILDILVAGQSSYKIIDKNILEVKWPLQDGRVLRLFSNLSQSSVFTKVKIPNLNKMLFCLPSDSYNKLEKGEIVPYTVIWSLE